MKPIGILFLFMVFYNTTFAQNNYSKDLTKEDYLHKSKVKKIIAYGFLGAGVMLFITGGIIDHVKKPELLAGFGYEVIGLSSALVSIPFFTSSSKYKRKAMLITLNTQKTVMFKQTVTLQYIQPAVTFNIKF
jgi:hypothetical protein